MSEQPQKYQNIREFLDNLPVVPCAWQPDNPNICNTCLRINDSVARICSVWAQAHEDAPLEEMEFDEEISLMPSIEAIEKDFEEEILESETAKPDVVEEEPEIAVEEAVAEVAAVEPVVAEEAIEEEITEEEPKTDGKKPFWKFWGKKEEVNLTEEKDVEETEDEIIEKMEPDTSESGFEIGEEVTHKVYGRGPIKTLYLSRDKWFADVEFYKGVKSILVSFLQRAGEEIEENENVEEESSEPVEEIDTEEKLNETLVINTERETPPIITPKKESQSGEQEPEITQAIPVEDIDDIEQEKDPEIAVREKVETEGFSEDNEE